MYRWCYSGGINEIFDGDLFRKFLCTLHKYNASRNDKICRSRDREASPQLNLAKYCPTIPYLCIIPKRTVLRESCSLITHKHKLVQD